MRKPVALLLVALLLIFAAPAQAKSPPQGKYSCFIDSYYQLFGSIKIDGVNGFVRFGKTGTYAAGERKRSFSGGTVKGYSIRFKGGPLNRYTGYWHTSSTGTHKITLRDPGMASVGIYCSD